MELKFFPIDVTYKILDDKPVIFIYGRSTSGQRICVLDYSFKPYFYAIPKKNIIEKIKKLRISKKSQSQQAAGHFLLPNPTNFRKKILGCSRTISSRQMGIQLPLQSSGVSNPFAGDEESFFVTDVESVNLKYLEQPVNALKIYVNLPKAVPEIRNIVKDWEDIDKTLEYDIPFARRYLIDKNIIPLNLLKATGEITHQHSKVTCIKADQIELAGDETYSKPKILAFDIETYNPEGKSLKPEKHPILMVAFYGENFKKVITWKQFKTDFNYIEFVKSEADLIERFKEVIDEFAPDYLVGYYSDGFDFPYLKVRAKKYKIKLDLSIDYSELEVSRGENKKSLLTGLVHLDIFRFIKNVIRDNLKTDTFKLDAVAEELLGLNKINIDVSNLAHDWNNNTNIESYCEYNLHDAKITYDLLSKLLPNLIELVKIVNVPVSDLSRMKYSQLVEWYILKQAKLNNELAPSKPYYGEQQNRLNTSIKGAFVYEPKPGLYKNIVVFDYRSLYPSIIASHNISHGTLNCECCEGKDVIKTDRGDFWYCQNKKGFLSSIIEDLITRRSRIKELLKKTYDPLLDARSYGLKILANSFYGYLGFAMARWYFIEGAESTTAFARKYILETIDKAVKDGFSILYSDTDSIFILLENKTKDDAFRFVEKVNLNLPGLMELEFENFYPSGMFVSVKGTEVGAKKKYALLDENNKLKIRGFETVRRNWSPIAKEVQKNILDIILKNNDVKKAINYVRDVVKNLRNNQIPLEKVIIFTQLQKDIESYENIGPHVAAAQRMKNKGFDVFPGTSIKFIVAKGLGKIRDKVRLEDEVSQKDYDGEYYINNQVIPSVESIFRVLGIKEDELIEKDQQKTLGSFG